MLSYLNSSYNISGGIRLPARSVKKMKSFSLHNIFRKAVPAAALLIAAAVFLAPCLGTAAEAYAPYNQTYPTNGTIYDGDFGYELDYSTGKLTAIITAYSPVDLTKATGTVNIPDTISQNKYPVTGIAPYAFSDFYDQTYILNVKLPKDLVYIGDNAFRGCYLLSKVDFSKNLQKIGNSAFEGCYLLSEVKIPDTVTDIGNSAFYGCTGIKKVTMSKNLVNLGQSAFAGCTELTSAEFPDTTEYIGPSAFEGCSRLATVKLPKYFETISNYTFGNCSSLAVINMPESLISIGEGAFSGCTSLTAVNLPQSIEAIARQAFANSTNLSTVVVPYDLDNISDGAFYNTRAVIWGYTGSYAEDYAHRNGLDFRSTGTLSRITFSSDNYNATVNNISITTDKGLLLIPPSSAAAGDKLTISVSAPPGLEINRILINNAQFANGTTYIVGNEDVNIFVSYKDRASTTTTAATLPPESTTTTSRTTAAVTITGDDVPVDGQSGDTTRPVDDTDSDYITVDSDLEDVNGQNVRIVTQRDYFIAPATVRITNTEDAYEAARSATESIDGAEDAIYYAFDISLLDESGEENQNIMARGTITFMLPIPNELLPYADRIKVYHINDETPELLRSSVIEDINGVKRLQFESDSFSPYMLLAETDGSVPVIDEETTMPDEPDDEIGEVVEPYDEDENGGGSIQTESQRDAPDAQIVDDNTNKPRPSYNGGLNPHTGALIAAVIPVVVLICVFLVRSHKKRKRTKTNID